MQHIPMYGPKPKGFWSAGSNAKWKFLEPGKRYRVVREFVDFDKEKHPVGEEWVFAGYGFLPYDNGLSLFVQNDAGEWHIRMQLGEDEQGEIDSNLADYIHQIDS